MAKKKKPAHKTYTPPKVEKIIATDDDSYKVSQENQNLSEAKFTFDISPTVTGGGLSYAGSGGDGGNGGDQAASAGAASTGSASTQSNGGDATGGAGSASANGGGAGAGDTTVTNKGGDATSGSVTVDLTTGRAKSGDASNGNTTTGDSVGGDASLSGSTIKSGDGQSGNGGDGGLAKTGSSIGGNGGTANASAGKVKVLGEAEVNAYGGYASANGGSPSVPGYAHSHGAPSGKALAGTVKTHELRSEAGDGKISGTVTNEPESGNAKSANAQVNAPISSGSAAASIITVNPVNVSSNSMGGSALAGDTGAQSMGGDAQAKNFADATVKGHVEGDAYGGEGAVGGDSGVKVAQKVDELVVAPELYVPMDQDNQSRIDDGTEFPADWFTELQAHGLVPKTFELSDNDSYDVTQGNVLVGSPELSINIQPELSATGSSTAGHGGNGGNGGSQTVEAGSASTGDATAQANSAGAMGGTATATANGGDANAGDTVSSVATGDVVTGDVSANFSTGDATTGNARNGDSTTGTSSGGNATMLGNSLTAGDATTGDGGDGGAAMSGNSEGGDGGWARAKGGSGGALGVDIPYFLDGSGTLDMSGYGAKADGGDARSTGKAISAGHSSGSAYGGNVFTPLGAGAADGNSTGTIASDPYSGSAMSGQAQNNYEITSASTKAAIADDNTVDATANSKGNIATAGNATGESKGGYAHAVNNADATSTAAVYGDANGGDGATGGGSHVSIEQHLTPIQVLPELGFDYDQDNQSLIRDGNEFNPGEDHACGYCVVPKGIEGLRLSDNDSYKVKQFNQNVSNASIAIDVSPTMTADVTAAAGNGGNGGDGGAQGAGSGAASSGSAGSVADAGVGAGGNTSADASGGAAVIGGTEGRNTSGDSTGGAVDVTLGSGAAKTGDATNGNSTTGDSTGGDATQSGTSLTAGSAASGEGGSGAKATSGDSLGGDGGDANASGGHYVLLGNADINADGGLAKAPGGDGNYTGWALSTGAPSAPAYAGSVVAKPIVAHGGATSTSGGIDNDPSSAMAVSGNAQTNAPISSGQHVGGNAVNNSISSTATSIGGEAQGSNAIGQAFGGYAHALNEAQADSTGKVYGSANGGEGGEGADVELDLSQTVTPIVVAPDVWMPTIQNNNSDIQDGQEFSSDFFTDLKHAGVVPSHGFDLSDDDSYDVSQANYLVSSPQMSFTANPTLSATLGATSGNGGNGGNGGSQSATGGDASTGSANATSNAGSATGGATSVAADGGPVRLGVASATNTGGNATSGAVYAAFMTGAAVTGAAANGDSTTGSSLGGSSTLEDNALTAGNSTTGNGGDAGNARSGDSVGGDGGTALAKGASGLGVGLDVKFIDASGELNAEGGYAFAKGADAAPTNPAWSHGGHSGWAPGGDVLTTLGAPGGSAAYTGGLDLDPSSGGAMSGNAQNNVPLTSGNANGGDVTGIDVSVDGMSMGGLAQSATSNGLSLGGPSYALNDADGTSHALVVGYADGGDGAYGGVGHVDVNQDVDPIVIAPVIELPYTQTNDSTILDGNEFQADLDSFN